MCVSVSKILWLVVYVDSKHPRRRCDSVSLRGWEMWVGASWLQDWLGKKRIKTESPCSSMQRTLSPIVVSPRGEKTTMARRFYKHTLALSNSCRRLCPWMAKRSRKAKQSIAVAQCRLMQRLVHSKDLGLHANEACSSLV